MPDSRRYHDGLSVRARGFDLLFARAYSGARLWVKRPSWVRGDGVR